MLMLKQTMLQIQLIKKSNSVASSNVVPLATHKSHAKNVVLNTASHINVTSRGLPQTGVNKDSQLALTGLGFLSIFGGLI